jgi:hypothetical protein
MNFPGLDPIPLPAPVFFFKSLHGLMLTLHFTAVHLMLGGLLVATFWNRLGHRRGEGVPVRASAEVASVLPIVMMLLINLGIPPLLFTQVLYGIGLYTSSILIGIYWLSVVFLVMGLYFLLYVISRRSREGKPWWRLGLVSLLLGASVAKIYSLNMTLMLRPEVWAPMFWTNPCGTGLPHGDPTLIPRWFFMLVGSLAISGIGLVLMGLYRAVDERVRRFLIFQGGWLVVAGVLGQTVMLIWLIRAQPGAVRLQLAHSGPGMTPVIMWLTMAMLVVAIGVIALRRKEYMPRILAMILGVLGLGMLGSWVVFRDAIRDATLLIKGYDVWSRAVCASPVTVGIFLGMLAAGLLLIGWLVIVVRNAEPLCGEGAGE